MTEEIFRQDSYAKSCEARVAAVDGMGLRLDRTVFYPEGGGQPGDTGALSFADGRVVPIIDTKKHPADGTPVHVPAPGAPEVKPGEALVATVDWARRHRLMRMHTALHVMCAVIPGSVTGGGLADGKGRIDFDLPDASLDKDRIAAEMNRIIREDHAVRVRWIADEELDAKPELIRTMSVKPPSGTGRVRVLEIEGIDLQPCGGTHVARTGEIGPVKVTKIENKGRHNRRVNIAFDE